MKYQHIFFDLDGTLTDSADGIVNSVRYALEKQGIVPPAREQLLPFVGPPLLDSFHKYYGMDREQGMQAIEAYREYFTDRGWKENSVYEGIPEVLKQLKDAGAHLYIATSKPEPFAKRIAEHFGLDGYFDRIAGATLDERITGKGQVIQMLLEELADIPVSKIVMVGDREHDVYGAKEHGIACVVVLYGYGSRKELEQAQAMTICPTPEALLTCL